MAITVERLEATVNADSAAAVADLAALDVALDHAARDRTATVNIDTDNGAAQAQALLQALNGMGQSITDSLDGVASTLSNIGGAAGDVAPVLDSVGGSAGNAGKQLESMSTGGSNLLTQVIGMIPQMALLAVQFGAIYSAATIAVGALQMLTAAAAGVYGALAPLVGLLGAIPVGLGAIGGGIGSVILGFQGINKAMGAMDTAQGASTRSTYNAVAAARELKSARQGIVDANKSVARAEKDLQRAIEGVAQARKDAAKDLVENRRAVRDAVWNEEDAVERLKRAQENLARVQAGAGKSGAILSKETDDFTGKIYEVSRINADAVDGIDSQTQAQRDLIHAQEELTRATERRRDAEQHQRTEAAKGVNGSDKVTEAIRRQEDATEGLSRAHDNVAAATERLARVQEEQARRAAGGAAATNGLAAAMSKLTPIGQKFARFLHDEFMPAWETVAHAAQDGLLPGVETGLRDLMRVMPDIAKEAGLYAKGMGDAFAELTKHMTSKGMVTDLKNLGIVFRQVLFGTKKQKGLVDALIPLADILVSITKAAGPMTKALTDGIVGGLTDLSNWMKQPGNAKRMQEFFDDSYDTLKLWGGVLKPLAGIFGSIADAAKPLGKWMLTGLGDWLKDINDDLNKPGGLDALKQWFEDMKPAIKETGGLIVDVVKALFGPTKQGTEDSAFTKTIKAMRTEWVPAIERLLKTLGSDTKSGPAFVDFLTKATDLLTNLVEHPEKFSGFVSQVADVVDALAGLVANIQKVADSPAWEALALMQKGSVLGMTSMWVDMRRANEKGINDYEAYTKPRLEKTRNLMAVWMDFVPVIGPVLAGTFRFVTDRWLEIIGIFTSGDIAGGIGRAFADVGVNLRRGFAKALNPLIEAYNKIAGALHLPPVGYIDAYVPSGGGNTGRNTQGSGANGTAYNEAAGSGTRARTTTTGQKPALQQFGGLSLDPGKYIVGEKRPEVLDVGDGGRARIAAAVPRPMQSTGGGLTEEQLDRLLQRVLDKAKPNVEMSVTQTEHADPALLSHEIAWSLR